MKKALTIAGFDGSGGAGIQADIKTFSALGCYAMSVLTAIPIQNTQGVRSCYEIEIKAIEEQLKCIFDDIIPDAIKIGMLFNKNVIETVSKFLKKNAKDIPIVLDPVMVAKSGDRLLLEDAVESLKKDMIPIATVITPNIPETEDITGKRITIRENMEDAARDILNMGAKSVMLKGGHLDSSTSEDLFLSGEEISFLESDRINTKNNHGTGCTLSAAITSYLAQGYGLLKSCKMAKDYLYNAIDAAKEENIGKGHGPVNHFYYLWKYLDNN